MPERPGTKEEHELELPLVLVGAGRTQDDADILALPLTGALPGTKSGDELVEQGWILQADTHGQASIHLTIRPRQHQTDGLARSCV